MYIFKFRDEDPAVDAQMVNRLREAGPVLVANAVRFAQDPAPVWKKSRDNRVGIYDLQRTRGKLNVKVVELGHALQKHAAQYGTAGMERVFSALSEVEAA